MNHQAEWMFKPTNTASLSLEPEAKSSSDTPQQVDLRDHARQVPKLGVLIMNADDWGRDHETTERIFECLVRGTVSSTSAMVFMEDSERAAAIALERGFDAGLHLNFTTPFSAPGCPERLMKHQHKVGAYLLRHPFAQVVFHPGLADSFEYVVKTQLDEFRRTYLKNPQRLDGHHHMHLCANVILGRLMPAGTIVRRNFSFRPREKSVWNRFYRQGVDRMLAWRHEMLDFFFSLPPLEPLTRIESIFSLATVSTVEVETHPIDRNEYRFLMSEEILGLMAGIRPASSSAISSQKTATLTQVNRR